MSDAPERFLDVLPLGAWQANCYLLGSLAAGACVVVDPGQGGAEAVPPALEARGVRCEAILLTHGHLDHVWAVPELAESLDVPALLHPDDRWLWRDPAAGLGLDPALLRSELGLDWDPDEAALEDVRHGQRLRVAACELEVRHTPGHTPGSCVFLLRDDEPLLLSGDLLFAGSVGRTDLPGGSWERQQRSLVEEVLPLDDATVVGPGHGPRTTVGAERRDNPFLRA